MPGWWFTIESTTTRHFIQQLKLAVENALRSKPDVRAIMRARATKQRFPVRQWVEDLEKLQSSAIEISHKQAAREKRPAVVSQRTSTILETPGLLSVLQPRVTPSLRPRSAVMDAPNPGRALNTISEGRSHSSTSQAPNQDRVLNAFSKGRLLAGSGPGLGSRMGPSGRRKVPPPLLLGKSLKSATRADATAVRNNQRAPLSRTPSSPNLRTRPVSSERDTTETAERPRMSRSQSMQQLRPNDRKAVPVRLLGMQLSASRASALISSNHSPSSSDENSSQPPSTPRTPVTPNTAYYTPPVTPTPPPSRMSRGQVSFQTISTPATSVSGDNSDSIGTSLSAANVSRALQSASAAKYNIIHTPHAVDSFPSLGPHFFPHGGIPVLSTTDVAGERPDNMLQNVTPFFSDPEKEYETKFMQKLKKLNGKNSENQLCIEEYLLKSEKAWFGKLRAAELSKVLGSSPSEEQSPQAGARQFSKKQAKEDKFGLRSDHKPPAGLKRILRIKIGDWPVYSFLLAFVRNNIPCCCQRTTLLTLISFLGPNHRRQLVSNHTSQRDSR